jgi:gluconate 5-dehydrogenase
MADRFSLQGKIAVVTGSRGGLATAIRQALESAGAEVHAFGRSNGYDVTNEALMREAVASLPRIDILVNNAGVTATTWDATYEVDLRAPYVLITLVKDRMPRGGSIVNITSINAEMAFPDNPAYVAMKHGLKGLTAAFALDLGKQGIRVNAIGPGYFHTSMTEKSWKERRQQIADKTSLGRWGEPEDIMGAVIFLASNASSYMTGQTIYIDGGWLAKGL